MPVQTTSITSVYPMDSAKPPFVNGRPVYDREYNASDLRTFMSLAVTDGVWTDYLDELAPVLDGGSWYVGAGAAMARGLLIPVAERARVCDQADIPTGSYAYLCVAARFDSALRDGAVYARLSDSATEQPVRTESVHELILARVDWRGTMTDYRLDNSMCGPVTAVAQPDTDSFMASLRTAVDQFNLNVGTVESLPSGSTPTVVVRKPVTAGGEVYVDFGIPRGGRGEDGRDGESAPTCYVAPDGEEPPRTYGNVWFVDDRLTHTITDLRCYETDRVYPGASVYPDRYLYPGGTGQWVPHKFAPSIVATA